MAGNLPKVNIAVSDRILLHLLSHVDQSDRYMVTASLTRPGIAEACAQHPPNVSRAMRTLLRDSIVSEHSRAIQGEERRQKTWQLTDTGIEEAKIRYQELGKINILIRDKDGELLEVEAKEVGARLESDLSLLQILMHAQHEGVLTFGDIRFGPILKSDDTAPPPGRLTLLAGAHATYHNRPPKTRTVHGREVETEAMENWFENRQPSLVVHGIAGVGKSTAVANWLSYHMEKDPFLSVCWYPCQPWDRPLGLAVSLLHRFGIDEEHDPYRLMETLPMKPGADFDIDSWRRRLLAYLTDANTIRERFKDSPGGPPPYWLIVLDDVHHVQNVAKDILGALLEIAKKAPLRLLFISRTTLDIYDRRDVHTRNLVTELPLSGLSIAEVEEWLEKFDGEPPSAEEVHRVTGGHPLALELLELYGSVTHGDWLGFLDQEILEHLPENERELLLTLAHCEEPIPWQKLADALDWQGLPPERLLSHGLLIELENGMWLHEALRERLLREVGTKADERASLVRSLQH